MQIELDVKVIGESVDRSFHNGIDAAVRGPEYIAPLDPKKACQLNFIVGGLVDSASVEVSTENTSWVVVAPASGNGRVAVEYTVPAGDRYLIRVQPALDASNGFQLLERPIG